MTHVVTEGVAVLPHEIVLTRGPLLGVCEVLERSGVGVRSSVYYVYYVY